MISSSGKIAIAAFDFDVTITTRDTFVPFLIKAFGKWRVWRAFLRLSPSAVMVLLGMTDRDRFKARLIRALFVGESVERVREVGRAHAAEILSWVRPAAIKRIAWHKAQGDRLIMVSASLDIYLEPVAKALGFDDLLCTSPSTDDLVFDGNLLGGNCRGPVKVSRLKGLLGNLSDFDLSAYGDSAGDREMLAIADHAHYRTFEAGGDLG